MKAVKSKFYHNLLSQIFETAVIYVCIILTEQAKCIILWHNQPYAVAAGPDENHATTCYGLPSPMEANRV